jgi:hypothetical protein
MITYPQFFPNYCPMGESRSKSFRETAPAMAIFLVRASDNLAAGEVALPEGYIAPLMVNRP